MRWVLALLMVAALAGCTGSPVTNVRSAAAFGAEPDGEGAGVDELPGDDEVPPPEAPDAEQEVEAPEPEPLVALLTADSANGTAPLNVTFTLSATGADLANATWSLAVEDNGTTVHNGTGLPASVPHSFPAPGTFEATLTVTDGEATDSASLAVVVTANVPPPPLVVSTEWAVGATDAGFQFEFNLCAAGPGSGVTTGTFGLPAEAAGKKFTAIITGTGPIQGWGLYLTSPACGTAEGTDYELYSAEGTATITGTVLEGWTFGAAWSTGGAMLTVTLTMD